MRLVVHVLPCDAARGSQVTARELCSFLRADGGSDHERHTVLTLFRSPSTVLEPDLSLEVPMGRMRDTGFDPRVVPRLWRALRYLQPDVIVAHGGEALKYLSVVPRGRAGLVFKVIGTADPARTGIRHALYRRIYASADVVVGVSAETVDEAVEVFGVPTERTAIVQNSRDPELFRPRTEPGPPDGRLRLVFVGHLTATKRPLRFVELAAELQQRGHDVSAVVIGDGPLEREVRDAAAAVPGLEILGLRHDIPAILRECDIYVFTSVPESEGMPGVLIEAAMSGLPVVATDVPGASAVVVNGMTGFVVPPDDSKALLQAVETIIGDELLRRQMGTAAREHALRHFCFEDAARRWQRLIRETPVGAKR